MRQFSILAIILIVSGCDSPIRCDLDGFRITPSQASRERQAADLKANIELLHARTAQKAGLGYNFADLSKAEGCP